MTGRIVVGVDGSPGSAAALRWALDEAHLRGARVDAVHVWHLPYVGGSEMVGPMVDPDKVQVDERGILERAVAEATADADPGVEVRTELVYGTPAKVLVERADDADLLVVGSRGHGGFTGLLLGSVGQQVTHHAPCPVVIVRAGDE